jgi:REP element-mobilizing transposase RayT
MPRRPRSSLPSYGVFHLSTRGVDRCSIVLDDFDRRRWVWLRQDAARRFELITYAYCLMTNHYHWVVEASLEQVSRAAHRLNGIYAQGFNLRYARTGHLFGQRPDLRRIEDDEYLEDACDYVRANPVRAGLCARPADWPWSGSDF